MLVYISTKFGQNWFNGLGAMTCDERTYGRTDGRTYGQTGGMGSYFLIRKTLKNKSDENRTVRTKLIQNMLFFIFYGLGQGAISHVTKI